MLELCESYNLRFPIIADRYDPKCNKTIVVSILQETPYSQ